MTDQNDRQDADDRPEGYEVEQSTVETDDVAEPETDWGLPKPKSGMGKEIKLGVALLAVILCLFGYVAWQNMSEAGPGDGVTLNEPDGGETGKGTSKENEPKVPDSGSAPPDDRQGNPGEVANMDDPDLGYGQSGQEPLGNSDPEDENVLEQNNRSRGYTYGQTSSQETETNNADENTADYGSRDSSGRQFDGNDAQDDDTSLGGIDEAPENSYGRSAAIASRRNQADFDPGRGNTSYPDGKDFGEIAQNNSRNPLDDDTEANDDPQDNFGAENENELGGLDDTNAVAGDSNFENPQSGDDLEDDYRTPVRSDYGRGADAEADIAERKDRRSGSYQTVTQHVGRAASTTLVERSRDESAEIAATSRSDSSTDRLRDYSPVESHRGLGEEVADSGLPRRSLDDSSTEADFVGIEDSRDERSTTLRDRRTRYRDSVENDDRQFAADDDQTYGFNDQESSSPVNEQDFGSRETNGRGEYSEQQHGSRYVIEANDSFWSIARQVYDSPRYFRALEKHNRRGIPNPKAMRPGVSIETPSAEELEELYPELLGGRKKNSSSHAFSNSRGSEGRYSNEGTARERSRDEWEDDRNSASAEQSGFFISADRRPQYRVSSGDSLGSIARDHLGRFSRWGEIHRLNRGILSNPNALKIGTVLRLPDDATRERVVERPNFGR